MPNLASASRPKSNRPGRRRLAALGLIGLGWLLVLPAAAFLLYSRAIANPGAAELPRSLGGLQLRDALYGQHAIADVSRLHGKDFPLSSGGIGWYGEQGEITLWAAGTLTEFVASRMIREMKEGIAEGRSPFIPTGQTDHLRHQIYELRGMGQRHFFFQAGERVIWLAADPALADEVLQETLDFYP